MRRVRESLRYTDGRRVIRGSKLSGARLESNNNSGEKDKPPYVDLGSNIEAHDDSLQKRDYFSEKPLSRVQYEGRANAGFLVYEFVEGGGVQDGEGEFVDHQRLSEQMVGNYLQLDMPPLPPEDVGGGKESIDSDCKKGIKKYLKNPSSILFNS